MNKIFVFLLIVIFNSCSSLEDKIEINGSINNLPDGNLFILNETRDTIDVAKTRKGKFTFKLKRSLYSEPELIQFEHVDNDRVKRILVFDTRIYKNGLKTKLQYLLLEDGINLNGDLKDFLPSNLTLPQNIKIVYLGEGIKIGKQSKVMFNDLANFSTISNVEKIKSIVESYPYSFYYLYELRKKISTLSNDDFYSIFSKFNDDVKNSKKGKDLYIYVNKRVKKALSNEVIFRNEKEIKTRMFTDNSKYNLIVLWASWCGPCLKEIPHLKVLYSKYGLEGKVKFTSISLDENTSKWKKSLNKEQMPWQQLIIDQSDRLYVNEIFSFDGSIPTILLTNNTGVILQKITGSDSEKR
ncbi:hypothetical protein BWI93_03030 [Siphonobacter sp. BAB-5385]|uniref:TlpA family protein disulfide reductase n=1 Tax=Siphonobacter sp. BAB-5385 TaxID=1864822 RepID=UPI000B9E4E31|nr:TlpA disulfide reductase family protein [Siphonobacter sp. BAB-5385]OZI09606.1 hypothetical protein BWI93_03030 [Siphonobacter sp. BAB-5385]